LIDFTDYTYNFDNEKFCRRKTKINYSRKAHNHIFNEAYCINADNYALNNYRYKLQPELSKDEADLLDFSND
jgi:hypothetical protein